MPVVQVVIHVIVKDMSLSSVKCVVANKVAYAARQKVYGLHHKNDINCNILALKTLGLRIIDINASTGYLTTAQENQMLAIISNPNINL